MESELDGEVCSPQRLVWVVSRLQKGLLSSDSTVVKIFDNLRYKTEHIFSDLDKAKEYVFKEIVRVSGTLNAENRYYSIDFNNNRIVAPSPYDNGEDYYQVAWEITPLQLDQKEFSCLEEG